MRTLKFRAQSKATKEWKIFILPNDFFIAREDEMFDYENYCEFTGLFDREGREICEGDIVKGPSGSSDEIVNKPVYFKSGCFEWDDNVLCFPGREEIEIVGNIYENPELIK